MNLQFRNADARAAEGIREVSGILHLNGDGDRIDVELVKTDKGLFAQYDGKSGTIGYHQSCELFRALGLFAEHVRTNKPFRVAEEPAFEMLCFMADNSRNAVLNMDAARHLIRMLALMGYNSLMFYTEDTYEVAGRPYFGYMRGRFTAQELRELDSYAQLFGIEFIPCIQTLAHLNAALRWGAFGDVYDCADIMLAGEEKTYELIDDMLSSLSKSFSSRRINIGMDEAELLGAGRYFAKNGFKDRSEIMLSHLSRVIELCNKYGFKPMMWSDMFFKLANGGEYYDFTGSIPEEILSKVPPEVSLVYWDYYNSDTTVYEKMLGRHQEFHNPVVFAGGAWKWMGFAPGNRFSFNASRAGLAACRKKGISEVILTAWGDNGAECSTFSILPVIQMYAEACFAGDTSDERVARRLAICAQADYNDFLTLDLPNLAFGEVEEARGVNPSKYMFYQDVLCGLFDRHTPEGAYNAHFRKTAELTAEAAGKGGEWAYLFETMSAFCEVLARKCDLGVRLKKAYDAGDREQLAAIAKSELPELIRRVDTFVTLFRKQWYLENRAFGFDVLQIRFGGLSARLGEAITRINAYLSGEIGRIEELEEERLYYDCRTEESPRLDIDENFWSRIVTAGAM